MALIEDIPMVDSCIGHQTQRVIANPFPERDIFIHCIGLQLCFLRQVENLQCALLSFEGNDLLVPVHNGAIGLDGSLHDFIVVFEVDDDDFGVAGALRNFLPDADIVIGF